MLVCSASVSVGLGVVVGVGESVAPGISVGIVVTGDGVGGAGVGEGTVFDACVDICAKVGEGKGVDVGGAAQAVNSIKPSPKNDTGIRIYPIMNHRPHLIKGAREKARGRVAAVVMSNRVNHLTPVLPGEISAMDPPQRTLCSK